MTCVPWAASSARRHWVMESSAALEAASDPIIGRLPRARIDSRLTMAPPPLARSTGAKARHMARVPK